MPSWRASVARPIVGGDFRADLAACHYRIGDLLTATGRPAEALPWYQSARSLRETLVRHYPAFTGFRSGLAESDVAMGRLLWKGGRPAEAVDLFEKAKAMFQELARDHPTATEFRRELAHCYNAIGYPLHAIGKTDQALKSFDAARAILETLVRQNPAVTEFRQQLAYSDTQIGTLLLGYRQAGRGAGALREGASFAGSARPGECRRRRDRQRPGTLLQPDRLTSCARSASRSRPSHPWRRHGARASRSSGPTPASPSIAPTWP